ncbi:MULTISPECIES: lysophospholipid acyltransferase family protein [Thalassospira]|uniref:lysophospholipid acyltransferase family protein n=1 Tax=Thalassospira TaxID=168934 RepID=UPI000DEDA2C7|nr:MULTISPECIES: 1-acyl-sn-glycerol-3-phosphate acyltransferase [Thalassospira]RCK35853.1 acyl-phosphate glycerol 3-phosphate acyltransferase [Thalassospira xiamenensis]UKV14041.1 1-acyl-sn-glycerol-3-phosphate acyltransferase [Thalassospiraceae bacterium SW-3-3]WOI11996.1 1-acyl-sn-glycerol-3-phosphate acyltransferase [Thalassospira lucentensis]
MRALRAFLFNVLFFAGTAALCIVLIPVMPFGRKINQWVGHTWCRLTQGMLATSVGMYRRIRGLENLPKGPCILVAKHQSAWETLTFHTVVPDPAYILKKELTRIPLMGQFLLLSGQIAVDRSAGSSALKDMIKGAERALADGRQIVIFPEGTRTPPGSDRPYHPGIYALYKAFPNVPVIPVAINSGMFWGRHSFMKYGGEVTMEFLPAMEPDLDRKTFMKTIKGRIDDRTRELEREAQTEFNLPTLTSRDVEIEEAREKAEAEQQEAKTAIPMKSIDKEKTPS